MREPNFSESQLQQAVNTAFIRHVFEKSGVWVFANVPSLIDEFDLGWDSAFDFPWYRHPSLPDHEGCNFFIQYKLSGKLTSAGAKEWGHWKTEYFRFKIPHSTKDSSGKFVDDYHQWDRLNDLANKGYPTFYATNATLSKDALRSASQAGNLLNDIPLLDIRGVASLHKYVTFTSSSTFFLMHSEKEESSRVSFATAIERLSDNKTAFIEEAAESLLLSLQEIGGNDEGWNMDLQRIGQVRNNQVPRSFRPWITQALLTSFIRKHIGTQMLWLPKNG
jgi:hypothetical protein